MRWILVDRFTRIQKGKFAQGKRCVTRAENALVDSYPCYPVMPSSLLLEMMAQVGGVLAGATIEFGREVVLAKIADAEFPLGVTPPMELTIEARMGELGEDAAMTECQVSHEKDLVAKANIFFGLFPGMGDEGKRSVVFSKDFVESFALKQIVEHG